MSAIGAVVLYIYCYLVVRARKQVSMNAAVMCRCFQAPSSAHLFQLAAVEFLPLPFLPVHQSRFLRSTKFWIRINEMHPTCRPTLLMKSST